MKVLQWWNNWNLFLDVRNSKFYNIDIIVYKITREKIYFYKNTIIMIKFLFLIFH